MVMPEPDDVQPAVNDPANPDPSPGSEDGQQPVEPDDGQTTPGATPPAEPDADSKKTRNEVKHERYIDKLSQELRLSSETSSRYDENLFSAPRPYQPLPVKDGDELTPAQIEEDRTKIADSKFAEGLSRGFSQGTTRATLENFETKLDIDKDRVAAKWNALDPDPENPAYNPKLEQHLVRQYIAFTGMEKDAQGRITISRPNVRFRDFVDAEMQNLEDYASARGAQSANNVRSQASKAGIRPTGQAPAPAKGHGFDPNDPAGSVKRMTSEQYHKLGGKEASDAYLRERGLAPAI